MGMRELWKIRRAMSNETKEELVKGVDTMAKIGAYCDILVGMGLMPKDDYDAYLDFGALILMLGEGIGN